MVRILALAPITGFQKSCGTPLAATPDVVFAQVSAMRSPVETLTDTPTDASTPSLSSTPPSAWSKASLRSMAMTINSPSRRPISGAGIRSNRG